MGVLFITFGLIALLCIQIKPATSSEYRVVCYFSNWAQYRRPPYSFSVDDIDPKLCTHLILAFAQLNQSTMGLDFIEYNDAIAYTKLERIKIQNPELKILIAVGGYGSKSVPFTKMTSLPVYREQFINQSIAFVTKYGFDGIDLDWEYPTYQTIPNGENNMEEKKWFAKLLKEMRTPYTEAGLIVSAAVSAGLWLIDQAYDVPALNSYLDFVSLMAYDLNGPWNKVTGHPSPLRSNDTLNLNSAAEHWVSKGLDKSKLVIGLSTYGRSFNLADRAQTGLGAPVHGAGTHGRYTGEQGIMAYYEVCDVLADPNSTYRKHWLEDQGVPYIEDGDNWIGYEDERSIAIKLDWIKQSGYGGAMLWTIDMDDFPGQCSTSMESYPLLTLVHDELRARPGSPGEACLTDAETGDRYCSDPYAECHPTTQVCECMEGYRKHRQTCKMVVNPGELCLHSINVCSNGSACDRREQSCVCTGATFIFNKQCFPQSRIYEKCKPEAASTSCIGTLTTCLNTGTCTCKPGTSNLVTSGVCVKDKQTDGLCDPSEARPCDNFVDQCICSSGTCICTKFEFCMYRPDGFYADPDDCRKYYRCVSKGTYHLSCSEGLFWDNSLTICAFSSGHCGVNSLPPTTTTPVPTTTKTTTTMSQTAVMTRLAGPTTVDRSISGVSDSSNDVTPSMEGLGNGVSMTSSAGPLADINLSGNSTASSFSQVQGQLCNLHRYLFMCVLAFCIVWFSY